MKAYSRDSQMWLWWRKGNVDLKKSTGPNTIRRFVVIHI